jgi:hypothetical protein
MSEQKEPARISFSKDKVVQYPKGATGITGTSRKVIEPTDEIAVDSSELGNLTYNASEQLFKNLDALGKKMNLSLEYDPPTQSEEINLEKNDVSEWSADMLDNLSEEEVIQNLNQHLGYRPAKVDLALRIDKNGQVLPQRIIEPETYNGKVITQNVFITDTPVSEIKIPETNVKSIKDSFCRNCGSKYLETDNFCGGCGNKRN